MSAAGNDSSDASRRDDERSAAAHTRVPGQAVVEATLDDLRSDDVRFLEEAAGLGSLTVRVPSDELIVELTGAPPVFPAAERLFLARAIRWVASAELVERPLIAAMDELRATRARVVVRDEPRPELRLAAREANVPLEVVTSADLEGFPGPRCPPPPAGAPRVVVTGCFDWLHSGHLRFFLDAAAIGALYVVVGSDRNVTLLKGPGHPLLGEAERRYMVGAMRSVHCCVISSGSGWMDAEPEIDWIRPTHYVVNEDGDQPEKRAFCEQRGISYVILQRIPQAGLAARSSTELRGF
jgi:cytidyltransferase-like protein